MKNLVFLLFTALLVFASCKKDDDCNETNLSNVIVGTWDVVALITLGTVEFQADGDLIDDSGVFVSDTVNGVVVTEKRYEVESNTNINIIAETSAGQFEYDVNVTSFDCDDIDITVPSIGISGSLRRD